MNKILGICEMKEHDGFYSLFDRKTGHEFFRTKFPVETEKNCIYAFLASVSSVYEVLKVDYKLSGNKLMMEFTEFMKALTPPSSMSSLRLHIEGKEKSIDVDLN